MRESLAVQTPRKQGYKIKDLEKIAHHHNEWLKELYRDRYDPEDRKVVEAAANKVEDLMRNQVKILVALQRHGMNVIDVKA